MKDERTIDLVTSDRMATTAMQGIIRHCSTATLTASDLIAATASLLGVPLQLAPERVRAAIRVAERQATFDDLMQLEPRMKDIKAAMDGYQCAAKYGAPARLVGAGGELRRVLHWRIVEMIGWNSANPLLRSEHAFDVATDWFEAQNKA